MTIQANFPSVRPSLLLDFQNTKQLDSRITYTRASTATFYNGVSTAMAEQNLFLTSQELNTGTNWGLNLLAITANTTTAPDGTTTADSVIPSASAGQHYFVNISPNNLVITTNVTFSLYVKPNGYTRFGLKEQGSTGAQAVYECSSTGSVVASDVGTGSNLTTTITAEANGFYRIRLSVTLSSGTPGLRLFVIDSAYTSGNLNTYSWTPDGTSGVYAWGAQAENRLTLTAYTATTTQAITNYIPVLQTAASGVARFDNNPTTGESLGLLIEESRTNLILYSSQFDNASWTKSQSSITADTIVAPDGTLTGDKLVENTAATAQHYTYQLGKTITATSNTASVYLKAGERTSVYFVIYDGSNVGAYFNLTSGTITSNDSGVTSSITSVGNGWYRCIITRTTSASANGGMSILPVVAGSTSYTGDGYSGLFMWGAQLEAGAFATSYIPTVASQVTRAADAASMTGTNFSSWYNQGEGTFYTDSQTYSASGTASVYYAFLDGNNYIAEKIHSDQHIRVVYGGTTVANISGGTEVSNTFYKVAGAYKTNDFALSLNGATVVTDTAGNVPTGLTTFNIGSSTTYLNGTIKKIAYYPLRLSNTNLVALTS
jgi:hypothetical protein